MSDFVANGADYIKLTQDILDAAVAAKAKSLDEVKALAIADGTNVQDAVVARSGITGEKMELDGYNFIEGDNVEIYDHMGKHTLCTMVQTNKEAKEQGHAIAMQVAAMKPVALNQESVPQSPSTRNNSHSSGSLLEQSASLPGIPPPLIGDLRCTDSRALRAATRAVAASITLSTLHLGFLVVYCM